MAVPGVVPGETANPTTTIMSLRSLLILGPASSALLAFSLTSTAAVTAPVGVHEHVRGGEDVSEALEKIRKGAELPGMVALAFQDGEIVAWGATGVRALGSDSRMTLSDPIHLGSCSKAMTSTLVACLVEDEVLSWDTTIAEALPELARKIDEGFHDVTIEMLLKHRGGIAERRRPEIAALHAKLRVMEGSPPEVRLAILEMVLSEPPLPPNKGGFDYSNFGYMTAGAMVEELTGSSWEELMLAKVFRPLGMKSAGIGSPTGPDVPVGHTEEDGELKALPPGPGGVLPDAMSPAGLLHCNLADWGLFVADHLAGERGEDGLVSSKSYKRLHRDVDSTNYACGWMLEKHSWSWGNGDVLTHNGSDGTWMSIVFAMPEWDLTVLVAANSGGETSGPASLRARDLMLTTIGFKD